MSDSRTKKEAYISQANIAISDVMMQHAATKESIKIKQLAQAAFGVENIFIGAYICSDKHWRVQTKLINEIILENQNVIILTNKNNNPAFEYLNSKNFYDRVYLAESTNYYTFAKASDILIPLTCEQNYNNYIFSINKMIYQGDSATTEMLGYHEIFDSLLSKRDTKTLHRLCDSYNFNEFSSSFEIFFKIFRDYFDVNTLKDLFQTWNVENNLIKKTIRLSCLNTEFGKKICSTNKILKNYMFTHLLNEQIDQISQIKSIIRY